MVEMKKYLSRLNKNYPGILLYMLQSTEYNIYDFIKWLRRVRDFQTVIKRRELVYTRKIRLLNAFSVSIIMVFIFVAILLMVLIENWTVVIYVVAAFLLLPILLPYILLLALLLGRFFIEKPYSKKIINQAMAKLAEHPAYKIAVVGSYGKTTAKEVLKSILSGTRKVVATPGNVNQPLGFAEFIDSLDGDEDILIFEMGEYHPGDIAQMCDFIRPDAGFITGASGAHLENFGSLEGIVNELFALRSYLGEKPLYLNGDDTTLAKKDNKFSKLYGENGIEGRRTKNVTITAFGTDFDLDGVSVHSKLLGRHNIGIVAAAVDVAKSRGLTDSEIEKNFEDLEPFEHRMQPRIINGAIIIDDTYNGNFEGIKAGLRLLAEIPAKRKIYVTPGLVEQGSETEAIHNKIGKLLAKSDINEVVLMQNSVTDFIKSGLKSAGFRGKLTTIDDPLFFYNNLTSFTAVGDLVLMQNDWTDNY
jgi:UDP-N-acetylmuramoyl-tripeptide--D-alanyl-D-alanine ligase